MVRRDGVSMPTGLVGRRSIINPPDTRSAPHRHTSSAKDTATRRVSAVRLVPTTRLHHIGLCMSVGGYAFAVRRDNSLDNHLVSLMTADGGS